MITVLWVCAFVLVFGFLVASVATAPAGHQGVVQRSGRYTRRLEPGLHAVVPVLDRVRRVDTRPQELVLRSEPLVCGDHRVALVDAQVEFWVTDAFLACTVVDDYQRSLLERVLVVLREGAERWSADAVPVRFEQLGWELGLALRQHIEPWGLLAARVRVTSAADPGQGGQVTLSREFRPAPPSP